MKWNDPFEKIFFHEKIDIDAETYYVACCCFTYDWIESEEAAWQRSGNICQTVRVEYDFEKLCNELQNNGNGYQFYFSVVDYSQSRKELVALQKHKPTSLYEYLNMLSLKRKAFAYEHELRLFVVSKNQMHEQGHGLYPICADLKSVIKTVCLPPHYSSDDYVKKNNIILKPNTIIQSHLYSVK